MKSKRFTQIGTKSNSKVEEIYDTAYTSMESEDIHPVVYRAMYIKEKQHKIALISTIALKLQVCVYFYTKKLTIFEQL
ncbi:hypothetical protein BZZ01_12795 [Nostocales cyanobacterium HT-58-2]|nr:hypothetical protein BZZ01_12795 [Nostocales cyanobacterium HT-58-2]